MRVVAGLPSTTARSCIREPQCGQSIGSKPKQDLSLGTSQNDLFSLEIGDIGNKTMSGPVFANATVLFGVCNYNGAGEIVNIDSYDAEAKTIAGTFSVEISCFANCFDCGGQGNRRTYEGAFDINFRDLE